MSTNLTSVTSTRRRCPPKRLRIRPAPRDDVLSNSPDTNILPKQLQQHFLVTAQTLRDEVPLPIISGPTKSVTEQGKEQTRITVGDRVGSTEEWIEAMKRLGALRTIMDTIRDSERWICDSQYPPLKDKGISWSLGPMAHNLILNFDNGQLCMYLASDLTVPPLACTDDGKAVLTLATRNTVYRHREGTEWSEVDNETEEYARKTVLREEVEVALEALSLDEGWEV